MPSAPPLTNTTPPHNRQQKLTTATKATSKPSTTSSSSQQSRSSSQQHPPSSSSPMICSPSRSLPSSARPKVNSLLNLFGQWLFDTALLHSPLKWTYSGTAGLQAAESWEAGRAEACGTLCRIFTSKRTGEDILPVYLSRFYMVLLQGLQTSEVMCFPVMSSILLNSCSLFCCDLKGVNVLLPYYISALENILPDRELSRFKSFVDPTELRRASIHILLSLLPLPDHCGPVQSEVLLDGKFSSDDVTTVSFPSLKRRLVNILIGALQTETAPANTQMILAAMLNVVQDSALLEAVGQTLQGSDSYPSRTSGRVESSTPDSEPPAQAVIRDYALHTNTASGLLVRCLLLVTQRLSSHWRNHMAVCLSALELLAGLAKVQVSEEVSERKRVVNSVCSFIIFQCSRPPPLHSRDLHSMIVAAFHCLCVWLTQHPTLLNDKDCLLEVLEIVELGISGSKSRQEHKTEYKTDKEQSPASMRVKDAAEAMLSCIMQVLGAFPSPSGPASPCSLLNEDTLIGCSNLSDSSQRQLRYFVLDNSVIVAMLEQPLGNEQTPYPSLTMLIRGLSGRHAWTLQLHHQAREGRAATSICPRITSCWPGLEVQYEVLRGVMRRQEEFEAWRQSSCLSHSVTRCTPPPPAQDFQTARLFLSQFGFLSVESLKEAANSGVPGQLVALDWSLPGFREELLSLDQLPCRPYNTALIFYVRAGQTTSAEILRNVESSCNVQADFLEFLLSLGWPVEVGRHPGWTGCISTSWAINNNVNHNVNNVNNNKYMNSRPSAAGSRRPEDCVALDNSGGGVFNGERCVLYYADGLTEMAFVVPSLSSFSSNADWLESISEAEPPSEPIRSVVNQSKLNIELFPSNSNTASTSGTAESSRTTACLCSFRAEGLNKAVIVWLECFDDMGFAVREMALNSCHRRRLESDSSPPPHVRRKQKISEIMERYRSRQSESQLFTALFQKA
ncbi:ral GTPase-activating protein subunit beta-like [Polymixia lowei]